VYKIRYYTPPKIRRCIRSDLIHLPKMRRCIRFDLIHLPKKRRCVRSDLIHLPILQCKTHLFPSSQVTNSYHHKLIHFPERGIFHLTSQHILPESKPKHYPMARWFASAWLAVWFYGAFGQVNLLVMVAFCDIVVNAWAVGPVTKTLPHKSQKAIITSWFISQREAYST
jgi:hypothetical protein